MGNQQSEIERVEWSFGVDEIDRLAYQLFCHESREEWIRVLSLSDHPVAVAARIDLVRTSRNADHILRAINSLIDHSGVLIEQTLRACLSSEVPAVRLRAIEELRRRNVADLTPDWCRVLNRDPVWQVRKEALLALAEEPIPLRWEVLRASSDPHREVRQTLIDVLLNWGTDPVFREETEIRLRPLAELHRLSLDLWKYLKDRWSGSDRPITDEGADPHSICPFWDPNPAILCQTLREMTEGQRLKNLQIMPFLLRHEDERIRSIARVTLRDFGETDELAEALTIWDEPRQEACETVRELFDSLPIEQREELAEALLHQPELTPAQLSFAIDQIEPGRADVSRFSPEAHPKSAEAAEQDSPAFRHWKTHPSPQVRRSLIRLLDRWGHPSSLHPLIDFLDDPDPEVQWEALNRLNNRSAEVPAKTIGFLLTSPDEMVRAEAVRTLFQQAGEGEWLEELLSDSSPTVLEVVAFRLATSAETNRDALIRLQGSPFPQVRVAAMTEAKAREILAHPNSEVSWFVRAHAAQMTQTAIETWGD